MIARFIGALKEVFHLFFPEVCPMCGEVMVEGSTFICNSCMYHTPLTGYTSQPDNPIVERFWGQVPIVNACSFVFFVNESGFRSLVHRFKYRGSWRLAECMGEWFGAELDQGGLYGDVDLIVPVPLHVVRRIKRGYNQSEYIARGLSRSMFRPMDSSNVVRHRYNRSQTRRKRAERWDNVEGIFSVRNPDRLSGKHILLVDDVLTTGATIVSCAEAILSAVPDCRISIATLSVSKNEVEKLLSRKHRLPDDKVVRSL